MASVHIRTRTLHDNTKRHDVRYRRGGRFYPVEHAGTFKTRKEAVARAELVRMWLANGIDPRRELDKTLGQPAQLLLQDIHTAWLTGRRRVDESTLASLKGRRPRIDDRFGRKRPDQIQVSDVIAWVGDLADGLAPGTVSMYLAQLRQILDYAGVTPNPARDRRVELPKSVRKEPEPPDADRVLRALNRAPFQHRLALVVLEQTGARVSEICQVDRTQLDTQAGRILIRAVQAKTDRPRWLELPDWLTEHLDPLTGRMFPTTRQALFMALKNSGEGFGPHQLRHRRATLWHQQGVTHAELARRLGHARPSMSLEVYAHVLPLKEMPVEGIVRALRYSSTSVRRT